jgi:N-formylglutamate amidohydrolase
MRSRLLLSLLLALGLNAHAASPYLNIETGTLPLVLSVPHGGELPLGDAPERAKGTKVKDDHVNELAQAIQRKLRAQSGKQAWLVGANISRKYVDFNRKAEEAYEAPAAAPVYAEYYAALRSAVDSVRSQPGALLLDLHGQSFNKGAIFRGTGSGLTAHNAPFYTQPERIEHTAAIVADALLAHLRAAGYPQ